MDAYLSKEELIKLTQDLVDHGEDKGELSMWHALYDLMSPEERAVLCSNLQKELQALKKLT